MVVNRIIKVLHHQKPRRPERQERKKRRKEKKQGKRGGRKGRKEKKEGRKRRRRLARVQDPSICLSMGASSICQATVTRVTSNDKQSSCHVYCCSSMAA